MLLAVLYAQKTELFLDVLHKLVLEIVVQIFWQTLRTFHASLRVRHNMKLELAKQKICRTEARNRKTPNRRRTLWPGFSATLGVGVTNK